MTNQTQTDRLAEVLSLDEAYTSLFSGYMAIPKAHLQSLSTDLANAEARVKELEADNVRIRKQRAVEGLERLIEGLEEMKSEMPDAFECLLLMPEVRQLRAALNPGKESA